MSQAMAVPALIYTVMLFGPGLLCLRCAHLPRPWAVCCAPIVSISLVSLVGEFCSVLDIPATPFSIFVPVVCLPLLVHLALRAINGHADSHGSTAEVSAEAPIVWWLPLLFAVVGLIICNNLFISELPTPDSFIQNYDMQHHLNVTQSLIDANLVTSRGINLYMSESDAMLMPFGYGSFYPAAWYGQCSLLAQATGVSVPIAINVTLAITLGIAYPIGMCAFASQVFGKHGQCVTFAAFTCIGFAMFPWCLLIFGPLYPNLVGFSLMPASMALCIRAIQSTASKQGRALAWIVALLALIGQALLHPNTLFSMYVILIPFVAQTIYTRVDHKCCARKAVLAVSGFLLACLVFWTICYKSPAFSGVIGEFWPRYAYPWQEVINILSQTYTLFFFSEITAQVLLGSLVVIGFIRMVYDEKTRWLSASYILTCAICFV
ncbi:MAG: hypothetical protein IJI12_04350, partial [Atopobiaceae bacterium]|nr:hypothetical protein [Atopobiaceae bacterium]